LLSGYLNRSSNVGTGKEGAAVLAGACTKVSTPPDATTIALEKPVHFSAPDGTDVIAVPGTNQVERAESRLRYF